MDLDVRTADVSTIRRLDSLVLFWLVLWLVIGSWTGYTIWRVSELGDAVTTSGQAIGSAGEAIASLGVVPVVGDSTAELGTEVVVAGDDIAVRGQEVQSRLRQLSVLLGLAIVFLPAAPVLFGYLPGRRARQRDVVEVRGLLQIPGAEKVNDRYLAERALDRLPFAVVRQIDEDPWRALAEGRSRPLADAELRRLGLQRSGG